jgi:hypothetical protein
VQLGIGRALRFQATTFEQRLVALRHFKSATSIARENECEPEIIALAAAESVMCYVDSRIFKATLDQTASGSADAVWQLGLYQSCRWAQELRETYIHACPASHAEVFALRLREILAMDQSSAATAMNERLRSVGEFLSNNSPAYRALRHSVAATLGPDGTIISNGRSVTLPDKTKFVMLQHSDDGSLLFAATFSKLNFEPLDESDEVSEDFEFPVKEFAVSQDKLEVLLEEAAKFGAALQKLTTDNGKGTQTTAGLDTKNPRFTCDADAALAWNQHVSHVSEYLGEMQEWLTKRLHIADDEQLVILSDSCMLPLPLEALALFAPAASVTRDFSLGMFCHRLAELSDVGCAGALKGDAACVVDPLAEGFGAELADVVDKHGGPMASTTPDESEIKSILVNKLKPTFLYVASGSIQTLVRPAALATTAVGCHATLIFDRYDSSASMKMEQARGATEVEKMLDRPMVTAGLLSLQGVKAVVCNRWNARLEDNVAAATVVFDSLSTSKRLGVAMDDLVKSYQRRPKEAAGCVAGDGDEPSAPTAETSDNAYRGHNTFLFGLPHLTM